jgi:hypothetical protein
MWLDWLPQIKMYVKMLYAYEWLETICSIKSTAGFCDHKVAD